jgi:hypothetical protein
MFGVGGSYFWGEDLLGILARIISFPLQTPRIHEIDFFTLLHIVVFFFLGCALFERVVVNSNLFQLFSFTDSMNNYIYTEHIRKTITKVIVTTKVTFVESSHNRRTLTTSMLV